MITSSKLRFSAIWKIILMLLVSSFLTPSFVFARGSVDPDDYFKNLSSSERSQYIEIAETVNPESAPSLTADILAELSETCGFAYNRDINGTPILPVVLCDYNPDKKDNPLDGMSPKFNCKFREQNGKLEKRKVKYFIGSVDQLEIPQAVITASLMRLMGFYADTYCPAIVRCKGCSPDPWSHKSQAPPIPDSEVEFKNAVVEFKVKGEKISVTRTAKDPKPLGFEWRELKRTSKNFNEEEKELHLIERETLMLFNNFVYHTDADPHNNRLVCRKWEDNGSALRCTDVAAYTHDVGSSFKYMDFGFYSTYAPLFASSSFLGGKTCQGGLGRGDGIIKEATYSDESRSEFLRRFNLVSDQQLLDLFELAQVRKMGVEPKQWVRALRNNANSMISVECPDFDSGKSVLDKKIWDLFYEPLFSIKQFYLHDLKRVRRDLK